MLTRLYSNIKRKSRMLLIAGGMLAGLLTYSGCDRTADSIVNASDCVDCDKHPKGADSTKAFNLCADVSFGMSYVRNSLPGVKDISFKKVPNDDCGYISDEHGNIIGREEPWQVMSIESDSTNDSLVNIVRRDIAGAVILNKVWLKDSLGNNSSIIANNPPYSATHIEVDLDAREIPDQSQWVIRDGKKMIPGVGGYVRNGNIEILVHAYGEERSSRNSTYQLIKIVNPSLMPYSPRP